MDPVTRQILGYQDFGQNPQKTIFGHFPNAAKKPSKNLQKTVPSGAPPKVSKNP